MNIKREWATHTRNVHVVVQTSVSGLDVGMWLQHLDSTIYIVLLGQYGRKVLTIATPGDYNPNIHNPDPL